MAPDRYSRPFLLPEHLHCEGFPLEIAAGALLVDAVTNDVLAQLKMVSLSDSTIKAVKVTLQPEDTRGEALGDQVSFQYLDLDFSRDEFFGQKTPIPLPDRSSRSFRICDVEVIYANNSVISSGTRPWAPLAKQEELQASISDEELLKQYQIDYGEACRFRLQELADIWRCVCGATNRKDEQTCHRCGRALTTLRDIDVSELEARKQARLEDEARERAAQAERERAEKEEAEKKAAAAKRKNLRIGAIVGVLAVAVAVGVFALNAVVIPNGKYNDAIAQMESGDYEGAIAAFKDLGDYQDAKAKIAECKEGIARDVREHIAELIVAGKFDEALSTANNSELDDPEGQFVRAEREVIGKANVGDVVAFGKYDSGEPAEWIVLDRENGRVLILSRYAIVKTALNEEPSFSDDWTKLLLRENLQGEKYLGSSLFSKQEQQCVLMQEHVYDGDYDSSAKAYKPGTEKTCEDKVFFLNLADVEKYFPNPESRITTYGGKKIAWWLSDVFRRHKEDGGYVSFRAISWEDGDISWWGEGAEIGCRPAMWVSCEAPENEN